MFTFDEAQLTAWLSPMVWPFLRVLALFVSAPVLSMRSVPVRVKVALAFFITVAAQASLPPMPVIALDSAQAFEAVIQQLVIGLALGFSARIVMAGIEFAGEMIGLQMGLNFASFFDPISASQSTAVSRFFGTSAAWLFVVMNGHLLLTAAVIQSFHAFPVAAPEAAPLSFLSALQPQLWGAEVFRLGLWIALPIITMLLFMNLVLGLISRVASQINIFAIGFPITLGVGLIGITLTLPFMEQPFTMALERMLAQFQ
ncbi:MULTISPECIES: flagellar biosynthetic protein FliR [unclassified Methylibium]|uniref:flagellar biosynthetic protein FliR n=1 Tax=unclassified Methylibium TaxID=2633235 RepID=UPI0003F4643D|nr:MULTISPECIES: flagellar biosynthetic protein FliR [unclassified Methylibium]EWS54078.1 Flagellar biosynthetic protein FliR [Methylibium sp. T29]EWS58437.1 Flagellar biosynthetic protein FliR [Methylibium sp. T29-B]